MPAGYAWKSGDYVWRTETPFTNATLSEAEYERIAQLCGFIQTNGSGFGICKSCRFGGFAAAQP